MSTDRVNELREILRANQLETLDIMQPAQEATARQNATMLANRESGSMFRAELAADRKENSMTRRTVASPRFVVDELGLRSFAVRDIVSQISYGICFTRKAAKETADRRNAMAAKPACVCGEPVAMGIVHRTDGPCYVADRTTEK